LFVADAIELAVNDDCVALVSGCPVVPSMAAAVIVAVLVGVVGVDARFV